jgi:serine/threonine protein kinase
VIHATGTVLAERYEIVSSIGRGGMGAVYRAKDRMRGRVVAIKQMRDDNTNGFGNTQMHARFEQEWQILKKLDHPRIPKMYDAFQQDDSDYFVMEFIEGDSLDSKLKQLKETGRHFPEILLLEYALQILEVLQYLHGLHPPLLHRDIKPQNIIVRFDNGDLVLVDFGLAREGASNTTQTMVGTLGYAPLEQVKGHPEPRSDLYALGATMWHMLTATPPNPFDIPPVESVRPGLHPTLTEVVNRACNDNPAKRFASAAKMELAIRQALANLKGTELEHIPDPSTYEEIPIEVKSITEKPLSAAKFLAGLGVFSLVAIVGLLGIAKIRDYKNHPKDTTPHPPVAQFATTTEQAAPQGQPLSQSLPGADNNYQLSNGHPLQIRIAQPEETRGLANFMGAKWVLAGVAGQFTADGLMQSGVDGGAVMLFGRKDPVNLQSISFRLARPQAASFQLQLRGAGQSVKLAFLSLYQKGAYLNALMVPDQQQPPTPIRLPAQQYAMSLPVRITQTPAGVELAVGESEKSTLGGAKLDGILGIQLVLPPANEAQKIQVLDFGISQL